MTPTKRSAADDGQLLDDYRAALDRLNAFCDIADHALALRRLIRLAAADWDMARLLDLNLLRDEADYLQRKIDPHKQGRR